MKRSHAVIAVTVALAALGLGGCGGGDDEEDKKATPPATEAPPAGGGATAPSAPGRFPPELVECYEKRGYKIESPADIHSAPPEVVQECFGALHQGGGAP